ncbi:MAG: hypothetical protein ACTSUC_01890 [Promethearchaeota archaeon]
MEERPDRNHPKKGVRLPSFGHFSSKKCRVFIKGRINLRLNSGAYYKPPSKLLRRTFITRRRSRIRGCKRKSSIMSIEIPEASEETTQSKFGPVAKEKAQS